MVNRINYQQRTYEIIQTIKIDQSIYLILSCEQEKLYVEQIRENGIPLYFLPPKDIDNNQISDDKKSHYKLLSQFISFLKTYQGNLQDIVTLFNQYIMTQPKRNWQDIKTYLEEHAVSIIDEGSVDIYELIDSDYIIDPSFNPQIITKEDKKVITIETVKENILPTTVEITEPIKEMPTKKFSFSMLKQVFALILITITISLSSLFYILISV